MIALASDSRIRDAFWAGLRPDPLQTLSEWSDENMVLTNAAEKGKFRTDRTPYAREIMDCLSPSHPCQEVVLMKSHQMCGTQILINWAGFVIDRSPANMMLVEPTVDVATKLSKQKIQKMLGAVESLKGKIRESRSRDSGNTILVKEYTGGVMVFAGANSGVSLRFLDAKYVAMDEVDAYPQDVDGEGHPVELAENRTSTFTRCKIYKVSTPLLKESSIIEKSFLAGSRGRYYVPCPFCLHLQWLKWAGVVFTFDGHVDLSRTCYQCESCKALIPEHHKTFMLENGKWIHDDPDNKIRSFHINILYQPYGWKLSWDVVAKKWLEASRRAKRGDTRALKVIINTYFAETWEEKAEKFAEDELKERKEPYPEQVPGSVLVLTGAVDVQDDRLEVECVGWGLGEECWSIDYQRFMGSPASKEVWEQLDRWLQTEFAHEDGVPMKMLCVCIDTGGHHTKEVYSFVSRRQQKGLRAIKGSSTPGSRMVSLGSKDKLTKVQLYLVGTDTAKDTLFANFKLTETGPGYHHFPDLPNYDDEYFEQVTAEEKHEKIIKGVFMGHYYRKKKGVKRNEALDLKVYNQAALALLNPNLDKLAMKRELRLQQQKQEEVPEFDAQPVAVQQKPARMPRRGFVKSW